MVDCRAADAMPPGLGEGPRPGAVAHLVTGIRAMAQGSGMFNWLTEACVVRGWGAGGTWCDRKNGS